eukprot:4096412-Amphidinium_carterae.1
MPYEYYHIVWRIIRLVCGCCKVACLPGVNHTTSGLPVLGPVLHVAMPLRCSLDGVVFGISGGPHTTQQHQPQDSSNGCYAGDAVESVFMPFTKRLLDMLSHMLRGRRLYDEYGQLEDW